MLFFGKKNAARTNAKTGDHGKPQLTVGRTVGRAFNPDIGSTLRPLGQTGKILVDLIATIFVAHGLIPRNHPAVLGVSGARFTLMEVMGIAWQNLKFTRANLPQTLIFFTVVLSLGCSALAIVVAVLTLLTGTAHAQSMFEPVDPNGDIACGWINWLFNTQTNGCVLQDYLSTATGGAQTISNLQSSAVQTALITALGFYSDAILVVAAVVLFYHLASMVVETAHHGVVMGKRASQIWAPIRLVVAVGLLVPVASGLNSGQYIVIQLAQWGSGLASQTWNQFLTALVSDSGQLGQANVPYVRQVVADTVMMEACAYAYNQINASEVTNNGGSSLVANTITPPTGSGSGCVTLTDGSQSGSQKCSYTPTSNGASNGPQSDADLKDDALCGNYILRGAATASTNAGPAEQQAIQAQTQANSAFTTMQSAARTYAQNGMSNFLPQQDSSGSGPAGNQGGTLTQNTDFETIVNNYQQALQSAANSATGSFSSELQGVATTSSSEGWVSAGAWFNTIARVVGDISAAIRDLLPQTTAPKVDEETIQNRLGNATVEYNVVVAMQGFQQWFRLENNSGGTNNATAGGGNNVLQQAAVGITKSGGTETHFMDYILWLIDWIASYDGVWTPPNMTPQQANVAPPQNFTLGVQFNSANPLAEIAQLGHANIDAAYDIFDVYLMIQAVAGGSKQFGTIVGGTIGRLRFVGWFFNLFGKLPADIASGLAEGIGAVLGTVTLVFFTAGFMLAYFFPLIPFFRFIFGAIGWFLSLLESIVAVPLIALAHLTPEGEGLPGEKAKAAYYMLFNLFLKPVMMVFGLIIGLLIFNIAASAVNLLYMIAVVGTGGINHGHVTLARLVYSILYIVILYLCCNNCFKMIDWLPEHAIDWMGAKGLHHPQMTEPTEIGGYMTMAAGYVDSKIVDGGGKLMKAGGPLALGAMAKYAPGTVAGMSGSVGRLAKAAGGTPAQVQEARAAADKAINYSKKGYNAVEAGTKYAVSAGGRVLFGDSPPSPDPERLRSFNDRSKEAAWTINYLADFPHST